MRTWETESYGGMAAILALALTALPEYSNAGGKDHPKHPTFLSPPKLLSRIVRSDLADPSGYTPKQIRSAYGFDTNGNFGEGEVIAIVVAHGNKTIEDDLNTFSRRFGLPLTRSASKDGIPFKRIYAGVDWRKAEENEGSDPSWALETALDVQWAHAMAPKAAILLVVAYSASMEDLMLAVKAAINEPASSDFPRRRVVSMSWGVPEYATQNDCDMPFFNEPGITFVAASGDGGAGQVNYPASSPFVLAVGGSTLNINRQGIRITPEVVWNGSSGGYSQYSSQPAFQSEVQDSGKRAVPDISMHGDPATGYVVFTRGAGSNKGWYEMGGTSAAAPQIAALVALGNNGRHTPLTQAQAVLYKPEARSAITDISGSTTPGYNTLSGLGVPKANGLVPVLTAAE